MDDCKLGKAMASDTEVKRRPKGSSNRSIKKHSAQVQARASLAYARSIPRNRISAVQDLVGSSRYLRWQGCQLRSSHIEQMRAAAVFAYEIGYPLNLCIDINWTRTGVGHDRDGRILGQLMELTRKWLKPRYCKIFAQVAVRENPCGRPNTHILVHRPPRLLGQFERQVLNVLNEACHGLYEGAVKFTPVGSGNATLRATLGKLNYMCKGISPEEAVALGINPIPQGIIYGKPYSISQDIHRAARQRYAESVEG